MKRNHFRPAAIYALAILLAFAAAAVGLASLPGSDSVENNDRVSLRSHLGSGIEAINVQDGIVEPPPMHRHPVIQRGLTLTDMRVDVDINRGTAKTTIRQTLRNDGNEMLEGSYLLPLPKGAVVSDFAIIDGDTRLSPEVLDAGEARHIYQEIVRTMRDPGLLEYQDNGCFKVSVFPFQPGDSRTVEVQYSETLPGSMDLVTYKLPLRWAGWSRVYDANFVLTYDIDSDHDLGTISSPTHGISVNRNGDRAASGSFEERVNDFPSDFSLNIGRRTGNFAASLMLSPGAGGDDGYFMLSLLAAMPQTREYVPKDFVFVLDKSGSMSGEKIDQAKGALRFVLGNLNDGDRFNVVYYSDNVETIFEGGLAEANAANRDDARRLVETLNADGGTDINTALQTSANMIGSDWMRTASRDSGEVVSHTLKDTSLENVQAYMADTAKDIVPHQPLPQRPCYVVFLTDGLPTVGEQDIETIAKNAEGSFPEDVKLFVFGVGYDVNTTLLDKLSYNHHGSASYVTPDENIETEVSNLYSRMASPALIDIAVDIEGLSTYDVMPRELPDLFHDTEVFITGRYRAANTASATVNVTGMVNEAERTLTAELTPSVGAVHSPVQRLWATRKVSFLLDQVRLNGENPELMDEIDRLAVRYGIVTPYTSYLITEPDMYFAREDRMQALDDEMLRSMEEQTGEAAVGRSKMNQANQQSDNAAAPQSAGSAAGGGAGGEGYFDASPSAPLRDMDERGSANRNSSVNYVNNQTFVMQEEEADKETRYRWMDARFEDGMRRVQVTTYGDEYFELLEEYPELGEYLSQGEQVSIVVGDGLVLETTLDEVSNAASDLNSVRTALSSGDYID